MASNTRIQTVEVVFANSKLSFHSIEQYPILSDDLRDKMLRYDYPIRIIDYDDPNGIATYTWYPDGKCIVTITDGTTKIFWPAPTLQDAVDYTKRFHAPSGFFQFHTDGSVTCAAYGGNYYWGSICKTGLPPISGDLMNTVWDHTNNTWKFEYLYDCDSDDGYHTTDSEGYSYSYWAN